MLSSDVLEMMMMMIRFHYYMKHTELDDVNDDDSDESIGSAGYDVLPFRIISYNYHLLSSHFISSNSLLSAEELVPHH